MKSELREQALSNIKQERERHLRTPWLTSHDDGHFNGELAKAAACYAFRSTQPYDGNDRFPPNWPWLPHWFHPSNQERELIKAGSLIVAELERIYRARLIKEKD